MGGENSKPKPIPNHPQAEEPLIIDHEKFTHFRQIPQEELLEITIDVPEERDVKVWEKHLQTTLGGFESKEGLLLPVKYEYETKGFCGTVGTIKLQFENYPYLFHQQLQNRVQMHKYFDEEQLWYLLYTLVSASRDFAAAGRKIGDVRPHNIFINEEGHIKVANCYSWPYQRDNFDKTAYEKQATFLSPEEIELLEHGSTANTTNKQLSQSFSIGLTVLSTAVLFDGSSLYEGVQWYPQALVQRVQELNRLHFRDEEGEWRTYSLQLKWIITKMCQIPHSERMSSGKVEQFLRAYSDEILNLKEFDKRHIPCQGMTNSVRTHPGPQPQPYPNGTVQHVALIQQEKPKIYPPPQPMRQQPVQANPGSSHHEAIQNAQLVRSTYTYEPAPRVYQPYNGSRPQVEFQQIGSNPNYYPMPVSAPSPYPNQPVRPVSYQPTPTSNLPPSQPLAATAQFRPQQQFSYAPTSSSSNQMGLPSDLLMRIDKQLQQSRNQFPS